MSDDIKRVEQMPLATAAALGDLAEMERLVLAGHPVNKRDGHGWTALCWAAGRGHARAVELLLAQGADPLAGSRDHRTPLMIARAAEHEDVVRILGDARPTAQVPVDATPIVAYCRAYPIEAVRRFEHWHDGPDLTDQHVVYVHHDFTVTASIRHGDRVLVESPTSAWIEFCRIVLGFSVPASFV